MEFKEGNFVELVDRKGKKYFVKLFNGKVFRTHHGAVPHEELIGKEEGERIEDFVILKPTLWDFLLNMKRISGIIYPKDIGFIWIWGDIFYGAKVVEGGIGSGAMLISLARAVGEKGEIISYELRDDMIKTAKENLKNFYGEIPKWIKIKKGDIYENINEKGVDRVILDVPEPWEGIKNVYNSLKNGGIVISYLPTIIQTEKLHKELGREGFICVETEEVFIRGWHIKGKSVRPEQRMVGHTGFIVKGIKAK